MFHLSVKFDQSLFTCFLVATSDMIVTLTFGMESYILVVKHYKLSFFTFLSSFMKSLQQLQVSAENDTTSMSFANMHITFKLDFHNYKNSLNDSREKKR